MGKSLYRSYRSKSFDEIVGQEHIITVLKNALKKGSISHAYLLSGPRGTGKTSVARILAYAVNEQAYNLEATHLDIIEIDAASNRRIDEVRDIREKVGIAPSVGKYKVYIIDEVHMLTREAFNALLKTLEEPPAHAIFILATTETHKVPETIISRCIRLNFRPIETPILADHLKMIAKSEGIKISNKAAFLLAEHGRGSFRDAISLLEQVAHSSGMVEEKDVAELLGLTSQEIVQEIITAIEAGDPAILSTRLASAFEAGSDVNVLTNQIQQICRKMLLQKTSAVLANETLLAIQNDLLQVPGSPKPRLALELSLMKYTLPNSAPSSLPSEPRAAVNEPNHKPPQPTKQERTEIKNPLITKPLPKPAKNTRQSESNSNLWAECLKELKKTNNTLYGIARMASVTQDNDTMYLTFRFAFHMKQVNESKNRQIFSSILEQLHGQPVNIVTTVDSTVENESEPALTDPLQSVSNIFGAHEVLES